LSNITGPAIVASFGYQPVFVYTAACRLVVAVTIAVFGPRTGMRRLAQLSLTWRTSWCAMLADKARSGGSIPTTTRSHSKRLLLQLRTPLSTVRGEPQGR
jgi:hypothetical protein